MPEWIFIKFSRFDLNGTTETDFGTTAIELCNRVIHYKLFSWSYTLWFASGLSPIFLKWIDGDEIVPLTNWIVEIGNTIRA